MIAAPDPDVTSALLAALAWHVELGADEAIGDEPVSRFAAGPAPADAAPHHPVAVPLAAPALAAGADAVAAAREIAASCATLADLSTALAAFDGGALKAGARSCVFADGNPAARVMIVGEAPGRDEDIAGKPFVGRSGQLLDRMLAAINLDRNANDPAQAVYITNIIPWRPVQNRTPGSDETAMLGPFVERHIALAAPEFVVLMGAVATRHLLQTEAGITRIRGQWARLPTSGLPALPTLHPAYLLRAPDAKRLVWRDLLGLRAALDGAALPAD